MKRVRIMLAMGCALALFGNAGAADAGETAHRPRVVHPSFQRSIDGAPKTAQLASRRVGSEAECITTVAPGATDTQLDCDGKAANNEPHIVVDPVDPLHMIASSNDYDSCCDEFYTTFDGGLTWATGNMGKEGAKRTGSDPVTSIDPKSGNAIHASLNYRFTPSGQSTDGDVVASISTDGGLTWPTTVVVYDGNGADLDPTQVFNDKDWIVTDTDPSSPHYGRTYVTWSRFLSRHGAYRESPIWGSHSDDGGLTWSTAHEISGSAAFCTFQTTGPAGVCDEDQASTSAVGPDGTVYVAFINSQNSAAWETGKEQENSYLVVSSHDGGETWSAPVIAADMEDGRHDFPLNDEGSQTISGYELRLWSVGNIAISGDALYIVFSDNRAGLHDVAHPISDLNVYVVSSIDSGATWSAPVGVDTGPSDQWFPSVAANPVTGQLGVLFNDRDPDDPDLYNAALAVGLPGSFSISTISEAPSDPTNSLFFQANVAGCRKCAVFNGDYIGLAYGSDGKANMVWTDMRVVTDTFQGQSLPHPRNLQFIFYARQ